ncbi:hypothetical protein AZF37_02920 [endosymbiont 'TC1' of Trimyema compressum]|uniref:InlB B-repeat-containing protein n=1 Tax=endosymbiont 'TC1' of Trimyema compressum TaxID=243899 RepID=UPI0007F122DD|nr:InlB B-repeat-containing protein [endosymbiont 'TC1' of Trimyema compressum]AMP20263.1 hypothetical protein AZF37_02920 [endosymbiont 'TC1' of Trimyema compressum]
MEGIEYLKNLQNLQNLQIMYSIIPEEALANIGKLENLTGLTINNTLFSGNNTTAKLLNMQINDGPIESVMMVPIDNNINLLPLSSLGKLENLYITITGTQQNAAYSYSPRTHFDIAGLGRLTSLKNLTLGDFPEVDDSSFDFLRNLTRLKNLSLYSASLNNVESIATLPNLTSLNLNDTYVTDFGPIIDKTYFTGASSLKNNIPTQYYWTETVNDETVKKMTLHTNIKNVGEISSVGFTTINGFQGTFSIDQYRVENGEIVIDFIVKAPRAFNLYSWLTGQWDNAHYGIVYGINFKTSNNKTISYSVNPINVGKTIILDENYEGGNRINQYCHPLAKIEEPDTSQFTRAGYTLLGWFVDKEATEAFNFNTDTTENLTLYAKWDKIQTHTVTFETNGGMDINPILEVPHSSIITEPISPSKINHDFEGWYKEPTFETLWNFQQDVAEKDITLYAKWNKSTQYYTVSFESNGGTAINSINNIEEGKTITKPENPTKEGYTFISWHKDTNLNNNWNFEKDSVNDNITLYAKWQKNEQSVTSNLEDSQNSQTGTLSIALPKTGNTNNIIAYIAILTGTLTLVLYVFNRKQHKNK